MTPDSVPTIDGSGAASPHSPRVVDFLAAQRRLSDTLVPTPLSQLDSLSKQLGINVFAKHENLNKTRTFKIRGALNALLQLTEEERNKGVITASTGNHGMAVTYAARLLGVDATIVVPFRASETKVRRLEELSADVRRYGDTLGEALVYGHESAKTEGRLFVEDGDDPALMVGAGTISLEILSALPFVDALLVPVGGGNLIAGMAACAKQLNPELSVVGIQSEAANAATKSWRARKLVASRPETFAGGLSADYPGDLALTTMLSFVDEMIEVSEEDLYAAIALLLEDTGQVVEGAGAAAVAGLVNHPQRWAGKTVVVLMSGGNADPIEIATALRTRENRFSETTKA